MKAAALALALVVSAVQTVGWVECCCILICKHRNDPCSDCKEKQEAATTADCCEKKSEKKDAAKPASHDHEKRCSHVEPSSEVVTQTAPPPPVDFDLVLDLPVVPVIAQPFNVHRTDLGTGDSRGSPPPLHLLYSVLLI